MESVVPNLGQEFIYNCDSCLNDPASHRMPHGGACLERAEYGHQNDRRPSQFGSKVVGNPCETDQLHMQHPADAGAGAGTVKVAARVVLHQG